MKPSRLVRRAISRLSTATALTLAAISSSAVYADQTIYVYDQSYFEDIDHCSGFTDVHAVIMKDLGNINQTSVNDAVDAPIMHSKALWTEEEMFTNLDIQFYPTEHETWKMDLIFGREAGGKDDEYHSYHAGQIVSIGRVEMYHFKNLTVQNMANDGEYDYTTQNVQELLKYIPRVGWLFAHLPASFDVALGGMFNCGSQLGLNNGTLMAAGMNIHDNYHVTFQNVQLNASDAGKAINGLYCLGGVIYTRGSTTNISDNYTVQFIDCGIYLDPSDWTEWAQWSHSEGGAIDTTDLTINNNKGMVEFNGCYINRNGDRKSGGSNGIGGAIHLEENGSISYNERVRFTGNYINVQDVAYGGAIDAGNLLMEGNGEVLFQHNYASSGGRNADGGAISGGHITIKDTIGDIKFLTNFTQTVDDKGDSSLGGAICGHIRFVDNKGDIVFDGNYAQIISNSDDSHSSNVQGGAIYAKYGSEISGTKGDISFTNNYVLNNNSGSLTGIIKSCGGAIFINQSYDVDENIFYIKDNKGNISFTGNKALAGENSSAMVAGGAIYIEGSTHELSELRFIPGQLHIVNNSANVTFSGNVAENAQESSMGGAIFLAEDAQLHLIGNKSVTFKDNRASYGSAIYGDTGSNIYIANNGSVLFSGNEKTNSTNGSAIYSKGSVTITGNDSVTFQGNDGYAIYMESDDATDVLEIVAEEGQSVTFDHNGLYSNQTVRFNNSATGGNIYLNGSSAVGSNIYMGKGNLYINQRTWLTAQTVNISDGATLHATGTGNYVHGELWMEGTLSLHAGEDNLCTGSWQTGELYGEAVLSANNLNITDQSFTLDVTVSGFAPDSGIYKLLSLDHAFSENEWDSVTVTGDVIKEELYWNKDYTTLYILPEKAVEAGDRTWTNKSGSATWNFMARNWMITPDGDEIIDGVKYRDATQTTPSLPVGVFFTDECESMDDVLITAVVSPRDITVDAERDYTFVDAGGGKISGSGGLIKKGTGTLTIAIDNDFTGDFMLYEGTVRVQSNHALGAGDFSSVGGTKLLVDNDTQLVLNERSTLGAIMGAVEVDTNSSLSITTNNSYCASDSIINGGLKFLNPNTHTNTEDYGAGTLSGSGVIELDNADSTQELVIKFKENTGFNGSFLVKGYNSHLIIKEGGYQGNGILHVAGNSNRLTIAAAPTNITDGGSVQLQDGGTLSAYSVNFGSGSELSVYGAGNKIELSSESSRQYYLTFDGGSTLNFTLTPDNACDTAAPNEAAALVVNKLAYFNAGDNATIFNITLNNDVTVGHNYALLHAENGYTYFSDEWNAENIQVTGDLLFSDLQWIDSDHDETVDTLILSAPDTVVWTNGTGSNIWNIEKDENWKRVEYRDSAIFRTNDHVRFTDTCTIPDGVDIAEAVSPADILVRAERDYTFLSSRDNGKITGSCSLTKEGSGTLRIALANDFSGGITIKEGKLLVLHEQALGTGALQLQAGATLEVYDFTTLSLNNSSHQLLGNIIVNDGATLQVSDGTFNISACTVDGSLLMTGAAKNYTAATLDGSGQIQLSGQNNSLRINNLAASDFSGTISVEGAGNNLYLDTDNESTRAHLVGIGSADVSTHIYVKDAANTDTYQVAHLADGGSLTLKNGMAVEARQVIIDNGATLKVSGNGNSITQHIDMSNPAPNQLLLLKGSTLDFTLGSVNALSVSRTEAALITNAMPIFGTADATAAQDTKVNLRLTIAEHATDATYVLMDVRGTSDLETLKQNWTEQRINVSGDAVFSDLAWIADEYAISTTAGLLVFNAPVAVVWRNSTGTDIWNTEADANWKRFTAYDADKFRSGDNVRFTDSCTDMADVRISGEVAPGSILVNAERNYTFTAAENGGKITGNATLTKQGSGTLILALDNDFSGGVDLKEGTIYVKNSRALGTGKVTTAENTLLVISDAANVEIATEDSAIKGHVGVDTASALNITRNNTYAAQATITYGKLQFSGSSTGGSTDSLAGHGSLILNTEGASRFTIAHSASYSGSLLAQGQNNTIVSAAGGYQGQGTLAATANNAALVFEGQDILLGNNGLLQAADGGTITAENILLYHGATLLAGFAPDTEADSAEPAALSTFSLEDAATGTDSESVAPAIVTLNADLSLYAGSSYEQYGTVFSLNGHSLYLYDEGSITLTTNLAPIITANGMRDFLLFEDAAGITDTTDGGLRFVVTGYEDVETQVIRTTDGKVYVRVIPEPTTATLSLLALAVLAARRRRK